jgi:mRNA-degrading endonuclease YafQ of YafQ-DinJ toxin-antitoxin module
MYEVVYAQSARKALKKLRRSGSFSESVFRELLGALIQGEPPPARFRDMHSREILWGVGSATSVSISCFCTNEITS